MSENGTRLNSLVERLSQQISLIPADSSSETAEFFYEIFAQDREAIFAHFPREITQQLLRMQHKAQAAAYQQNFPHAEHFVILYQQNKVGKLSLAQGTNCISIMDILLAKDFQRLGIGSHIILELKKMALSLNFEIQLKVFADNSALEFFLHHGFVAIDSNVGYIALRWLANQTHAHFQERNEHAV